MKPGNKYQLMIVIDQLSPYYIDYGYLFAWHCIVQLHKKGGFACYSLT